MEGRGAIVAVQFGVLPEPDFRDCRPEDLSYERDHQADGWSAVRPVRQFWRSYSLDRCKRGEALIPSAVRHHAFAGDLIVMVAEAVRHGLDLGGKGGVLRLVSKLSILVG